jgi:hypothetical protein
VDASTGTGIGLYWNGLWEVWYTQEGWCDPIGHNIGWLETIAIKFAVTVTSHFGISNADFLIRSDNEGAIGAFHKGCCSNLASNMCIRCTETILQAADLSISLIYVNTSINLADSISCGILPDPSTCLPFHIPISDELAPFITYIAPKQ